MASAAGAAPQSAWAAFWIKHDPDQVFAYSTIKLVSIKDRYLGIFHYLAMFVIFLYIVFWVILYQKAYLKYEPPVGAIRVSLVDPSPVPTTSPSYCSAPTVNGCKYWMASQASAQSDGRQLFVTTDVQITSVTRSCNDTSIACLSTIGNASEYFIGNIESFSVSIDHSPRSPNLGITFSTGDIAPGVLQYLPDPEKPNTWADKQEFNSLASDILPLDTLLDAAHFDLDAPADEYLHPDVVDGLPSGWKYQPYTADQKFKPYRQFGGVLLLMIYYDNHEHGFVANENIIYYAYRPIIVSEIDDFVLETVWTDYPTERVQLVRRGVHIVAVMTGNLGRFDFQTLLIQLTSALALIAVSKTIVDSLAIYVLPRKKHYYKAKYEETEDFSDLMDELKKKKMLAKGNTALNNLGGLTEAELEMLRQQRSNSLQSGQAPPVALNESVGDGLDDIELRERNQV